MNDCFAIQTATFLKLAARMASRPYETSRSVLSLLTSRAFRDLREREGTQTTARKGRELGNSLSGIGNRLRPSAGDMGEQVRQQQVPVIGAGQGVASFVHIEHAAFATVTSLERAPGVMRQSKHCRAEPKAGFPLP